MLGIDVTLIHLPHLLVMHGYMGASEAHGGVP